MCVWDTRECSQITFLDKPAASPVASHFSFSNLSSFALCDAFAELTPLHTQVDGPRHLLQDKPRRNHPRRLLTPLLPSSRHGSAALLPP